MRRKRIGAAVLAGPLLFARTAAASNRASASSDNCLKSLITQSAPFWYSTAPRRSVFAIGGNITDDNAATATGV